MSDDSSTAETTQSFAPRRRPDAPGEKTASFAPRPAEQPAETTQSFAPRPAPVPQPTQWNPAETPAAPVGAPGPELSPESQGATSPVPGPLATASFAPAQPAQPAVAFSPPEPTPAVAPSPEAAPSPAPEATAPPPEAAPAATQTAVLASVEPEPAEAPSFPPRPSTLTTGFALAAVQAIALVAGGAVIAVLANGGGDWLQKRLDDWNTSHSATTLESFKHAADVVGFGAIALGLVVLILAASTMLYGQASRIVLTGAQVLLIAAAGVGVIVSPLSLVFALSAIVVIAVILAPQTSRAFRTARDAEEEWRASL